MLHEKREGSPIMWHFLSKTLLNKIYATSIMRASHFAIRSLTLAVCPSVGLPEDQSELCLQGVCLSDCLSVSFGQFFWCILLIYYSFSGPNRGHYITIVKSHGLWLLFDDDIVEVCTHILVVSEILKVPKWWCSL